MDATFLPVFSVNRLNLLQKLQHLEGNFGVLGTIVESDNFLCKLRETGKPYFIDSGAFASHKNDWHHRTVSVLNNDQWIRKTVLADTKELRSWLTLFLERCDQFHPDYVFTPDIVGEPLLSLHIAKLTWEQYSNKVHPYKLIGVVQAGYPLYNWPTTGVPQVDDFPPFYKSPKSFLSSLISEYRQVGYKRIALGGLLKSESFMPMGLKFGLSNQELDSLLSWSRPDFILGGLSLTRLDVLRKHRVWADSSNWLWWNKRYDYHRFKNRDPLQEVIKTEATVLVENRG